VLKSEIESGSQGASAPSGFSDRKKQSAASEPKAGTAMPARVGFVGLGRMGRAMAPHLAAAGHKVVAYVRDAEQIPSLEALGLRPTADFAALSDCELVITMLPDDSAVREVVLGSRSADGLLVGLKSGAVHLSMSTISPSAASELAGRHAQYRQGFVSAPVFGNPEAAEARQLYIIAAGAAPDLDRCAAVFDALGQQTFRVGSDPASANLIKLAGNVMSAATLEVLGEVFALARKRGLDPRQLLAILTGTMFGSRVHKIYGAKIAEQQYAPGNFIFPLALKDVRLALQEAEAAGVPMPSVSVVRDRLITGIARGYAGRDWSALGLLAAEEAGLSPEPEKAEV
jgi:3-hydroxyisobutyrate dehydrogenase-like beta-hydroxyacid dehydrogenase